VSRSKVVLTAEQKKVIYTDLSELIRVRGIVKVIAFAGRFSLAIFR
jgi:hypothetical protein